jgi:hypothetical protein
MFQNAMPHIVAPQHVLQLEYAMEKDLAGHAFMTIMKILFTDALPHGVMMSVLATAFITNHMPVKFRATAVRELKVIQMVDRYVLMAVVRVQRSFANLVADHVPQDLHVVEFFRMIHVLTQKPMKVIADHVRMFAFRDRHAAIAHVKIPTQTMTIVAVAV